MGKTATVIGLADGAHFHVLGHDIRATLTTAQTGGEYYTFECVTPSGVGIPPHVHSQEDEIIQVVEGEFEIMLDGRTHRAKAGTLLHFPRRVPHAFANVGATVGKTLWTVIPGAGFEAFFGELAALPKGPPDLAQVAAIFGKYGMEVLPPQPA
jgi:quercetin dioxygenase-like cupin family protein